MAPDNLADEIAAADAHESRLRRELHRFRAYVEDRPYLRIVYRAIVALVGGATVLVGIALLVLPGPGWLMIFLGLGILGSEFAFVRPLTDWLRRTVLRIWHWWQTRRAERRARKNGTSPEQS